MTTPGRLTSRTPGERARLPGEESSTFNFLTRAREPPPLCQLKKNGWGPGPGRWIEVLDRHVTFREVTMIKRLEPRSASEMNLHGRQADELREIVLGTKIVLNRQQLSRALHQRCSLRLCSLSL